ncbi:unnamed protein product [Clonostachys rosea f. rosea IK726]|uniref:Uncharacterized protein n=1 Tax=Clonostachys rosea f. rosea IK726 TaxID=1349383 RepID=A0ACA9TYT7_BIOOC|nr:unnamed protein product [Clonostachys rosea f. rosea IK726]
MAGGFVEAFTAEPQATGDAIPVPFQSMGGSSPGYILGLTMTALLALLGSASLLIRFAACLFCRKYKVQAQDVIGLLGALPFCAMIWCGYEKIKANVFFTPQSNLNRDAIGRLFFLSFVASMMFYTICILTKCATLLHWARSLFYHGVSPAASRACYILIFVILGHFPAIIIFFSLRCRPLEKTWSPWIPVSRTSNAPVAFATVYVLWAQRSRKHMWEIWVLYSIGFLGVCCSVGQLQAMHRDRKRDDGSNIMSEIYLWELAECTIVLMVFCLPKFRALVDINIRKRGRNRMQAPATIVNVSSFAEAIQMKRMPNANITYIMEAPAPKPTVDNMENGFIEIRPSIRE